MANKFLYCKSDITKLHFLHEPLLLPCNNSMCKKCIDKLLGQKSKKTIICNYCLKEHEIKSSTQLKPNLNFVNLIKLNFNEIYSMLVDKLKTSRYNIEGT
jgi:hypothetical protein